MMLRLALLLAVLGLCAGCGHDYLAEIESDTLWHGQFGLALSGTGYSTSGCGNRRLDITIDRTVSDRAAVVTNLTDQGYVRVRLLKRARGPAGVFGARERVLAVDQAHEPFGVAAVHGR